MLGSLSILLSTSLSAAPPPRPEHPLEPADTSSPRACLFSFINTMNEAYAFGQAVGRSHVSVMQRSAVIQKIGRHLDISGIPAYIRTQETAESATCLKEILDRVTIPEPDEIPGGDQAELPQRWRVPHTDIMIERIQEGPRKDEFLFSAHTVSQSPDFYAQIEAYPYRTEGPPVSQNLHTWFTRSPGQPQLAWVVSRLPKPFRSQWGAHTVWQWIGLSLTLIIGLGLMIFVLRFGRWRAHRFMGNNTLRYVLTLIFPLVVLLIPMRMKYIIRYNLILSGTTLRVTDFLLGLVLLWTIMAVVWAGINRLTAVLMASPRFLPRALDAQFIRLISRIGSIIAVIVIFLEGGQRLGIPLSTLLAGAGISGFAIAMAAQDTLKNILGSMMISLDKPFNVGDRIIAKGMDGVVEEIGLRSTKLALLSGNAASIPNEDMAKIQIENVGRRPHIKRVTNLRIPLDTPRHKLERAVEIIEELLKNHEGMRPEFPPRVYFTEFEAECFNICMIYWYAPPKYWNYLRFGQTLNFQIFSAFESAGIIFSLPARMVHTDMDGTGPAPIGGKA